MHGARGPKSKPDAIRRNLKPSTSLEAEPATPPALPDGYLPATVAWWQAWLDSPQAVNLAATDWQRLLMLAPLVNAYHANPSAQLMAEIRQNEAKLGATVADRERLGWSIVPPPDAPEAGEKGSRSRPDPRKKAA